MALLALNSQFNLIVFSSVSSMIAAKQIINAGSMPRDIDSDTYGSPSFSSDIIEKMAQPLNTVSVWVLPTMVISGEPVVRWEAR
jgi:hypothetical protein